MTCMNYWFGLDFTVRLSYLRRYHWWTRLLRGNPLFFTSWIVVPLVQEGFWVSSCTQNGNPHYCFNEGFSRGNCLSLPYHHTFCYNSCSIDLECRADQSKHQSIVDIGQDQQVQFSGGSRISLEIGPPDLKLLEFFLNVSLNSANSVTKIFVITVKGLKPATQPPTVLETRMLPQHQ